jgi:KDO2-lipid IV(A) lauroyltransferase
MFARLAVAFLWCLHWLPLPVLAPLGKAAGMAFYAIGRARRRVVMTNLRLCFPALDAGARTRLARAHYRAAGRAALEHVILFWGSKARIQRLVRMEGIEHWDAVRDRPVILLCPHFVGLDMGGLRIITERPGASMYSKQKNPVFDRLILHGRTRFGNTVLLSRQDGVRGIARALKRGLPFYYLPDMDFGSRDSVFVPFFGVPAATITGLSRLAQLGRARVVPAITRQLPGAAGYVLQFYPAWGDFPTDDVEADARRLNTFIEERVREAPEQYYWLHRRFKTRPPGEKNPYDA